jgi:hypothetical protein
MHFTVSAQYAPFIADVVRRAIREAELDAFFRADPDPQIQRFASVPDDLRDDTADGVAVLDVVRADSIPEVSSR